MIENAGILRLSSTNQSMPPMLVVRKTIVSISEEDITNLDVAPASGEPTEFVTAEAAVWSKSGSLNAGTPPVTMEKRYFRKIDQALVLWKLHS